jgi:hypothetical protein
MMRNISEWLASNGVAGADFVEADRRWRQSAESSWYRAPISRDPDPPLAFRGPDHPGHLLVTAGRVGGTPVFDKAGERIGRVFDVSIEKSTGQVVHVLVVRSGMLGIGRRYHPLPWAVFTYAPDLRGYVLPFARAEIAATAGLRRNELDWCGAGYRSPFDDAYYDPFLTLPIA